MMAHARVSVVVLTFNEERNLAACLESVADWTRQIFVVDSGSSDGTEAIACDFGAMVVKHPFDGHAPQWNWALRHLPLETEWVLCLDADHRITPELGAAIRAALERDLDGVDGFYVTRRQFFRGCRIRHGGYYPKRLLKLLRHRNAWSDENERVDFRFYVRGRTETLAGDMIEDNRNELDIAFWLTKHVRFARLQAEEEFARASEVAWSTTPAVFGTPDQRILWMKRRWYRMPLYVRPFLYFFYRYVLRRGFLDGKAGLVFHLLQAFWYRFVVDVMLDDLRRRRSGAA